MDEKIKIRIINQFRARSKRLRGVAIIVLALIFLSLASGIFIFVFSGDIAINEIEGLGKSMTGEFIPFGGPIAGTAKTSREATEKLETRIEELAKKIDRSREKTIGNVYLISTVTTRIGSVLILLFLVQILVSMYRYNIRLAAYYDARADGLELAIDASVEEIDKIIRSLSPENIDFAKVPNSPSVHAVELAKEIVSIKGKT